MFIVCNKYNSEWKNPPISFLSVECLEQIFSKLIPSFKVIYCRPGDSEIVSDSSKIYRLNDKEMIKEKYPEVCLIEDLYKENSDLSFNELQLMCFANSDHFISVQGGYSIFCSYFKGTNIIYGAKSKIRTADEIVYRAYDRWYHKFSGSSIMYCDSYDKIMSALTKETDV